MALQSRPEPMNASPYHSKVKVSLKLSDPIFVAGGNVSGKMEVECRADSDSGLGIGVMMVELFAFQEITSRDHSATSTFIQARRLFQGPGLPPSNAVLPDYTPSPGDPPLPTHHHAARRGLTTFFFRFNLPSSSPASITFGPARIRYEVRASVGVALREEKRLVTDTREVHVVESWDQHALVQHLQGVAIVDGGDIWGRAMLVNSGMIAGESACVELQLKNHSQKWTSGVSLTVARTLYLANPPSGKPPLDISDIVTHVDFRGPEYTVPPGVEGVANLVVDIPRHARSVRGGLRLGEDGKASNALFEVRCVLSLRVELPPGSEEMCINITVPIHHSLAVPELSMSPQSLSPPPQAYLATPQHYALSPPIVPQSDIYTGLHYNVPLAATAPWSPAMQSVYPYSSPSLDPQLQYFSPPPQYLAPYALLPPRPLSAEPHPPIPYYDHDPPPGLPPTTARPPLPPLPISDQHPYLQPSEQSPAQLIDVQEGKGTRASRISETLHRSVRHRSVSPRSDRYPLPIPSQQQAFPITPPRIRPSAIQIPALPNPHDTQGLLHSPRPIPSPKQSFNRSLPRSENVCTLERMADEVVKNTSDLSTVIPKPETDKIGNNDFVSKTDLEINKTLPGPPVPSGKQRFAQPSRSRADTYFGADAREPAESRKSNDSIPPMPPTPPHAAITPVKFPRAPMEMSGIAAYLNKEPPGESGLDALERRLLAEVGTRRPEHDLRPDVRSIVQPIAIPTTAVPETMNDSAISSLTLANGLGKESDWERDHEQEQDRDSDERTHHPGSHQSDDDRDLRTQYGKPMREHPRKKATLNGSDSDRTGRPRERKKDKDGLAKQLRSDAKGRIAAWLGNIDTTIPPAVDDLASVASPSTSHFVSIANADPFLPPKADESHTPLDSQDSKMFSRREEASAVPNPKSSGFVTISTLKTTAGTRGSIIASDKSPNQIVGGKDNDTTTKQQIPSHPRPVQPLASKSPFDETTSNRNAIESPKPRFSQPKFNLHLAPGFLRSPPTVPDPDVKYDIRSARGGRGGKVAEVASIWASKATSPHSSATITKPRITPAPLPRKQLPNPPKVSPKSPATHVNASDPTGGQDGERRTKPTKASTVPAVISSSHAIPMLSSTASLARVSPAVARTKLAPSLSPAIESVSDARILSKTPQPARIHGDLAFGQARLRDLIKKYQG
ncbi:hypothetical protein BJ138DRAFT_1141268 [Hygrophoropsis aurantiaca]|uniref:Uncharacterized protein n=1 Tax=Hygrophoropsis aurantiaca TaxID=72124 RepID=A0ACB8APY3_9AGAM|nr:hypothetical protein BJ138DRAFT_1141268 [Hygrophoropsis aurantiaca]